MKKKEMGEGERRKEVEAIYKRRKKKKENKQRLEKEWKKKVKY